VKSHRRLRRRRAALALLPATVALTLTAVFAAPAASQSEPSAESSSFETNKSTKRKVKPGTKVKVRGRFPQRSGAQTLAAEDSAAGHRVRIEFKPAGKRGWRSVKTTETGQDGRYRQALKVRRTGHLRAVHADGRTSEAERIRIKAKLRSNVKRRHAKLGQRVPVRGKVRPTFSRRKVVVRIGGEKLKTRTNRKGKFKVRWKANRTGTVRAKVRARGDKVAAGNRDKAGRSTVYRPAQASWYGPGFYGNRTACGKTLTTSTEGVAHKTMPCGTKLRLRHGKRTVTVKVIDRGPYHGNREFDLTGATKKKLGFGSTGTVWASK
jgi:rare lipoprotein A